MDKKKGASEISSEKKLKEYSLSELTVEIKELAGRIDETLLEKFLELGKYACRARKLVEQEHDSWEDYVNDNFSQSRYRINEAIAAYRASKRFKKKNKGKKLPLAFTKSVLTKAGQMLKSKNPTAKKSAQHLLSKCKIKSKGETVKADDANPMKVLDALKEHTKKPSTIDAKTASTPKVDDRFQVYKQYSAEMSKYFHRSDLASFISGEKSKRNCLKAIVEAADNICKDGRKLLKQTKKAK